MARNGDRLDRFLWLLVLVAGGLVWCTYFSVVIAAFNSNAEIFGIATTKAQQNALLVGGSIIIAVATSLILGRIRKKKKSAPTDHSA